MKHLRCSALSEQNIFMLAKFKEGAGKLQLTIESLQQQGQDTVWVLPMFNLEL